MTNTITGDARATSDQIAPSRKPARNSCGFLSDEEQPRRCKAITRLPDIPVVAEFISIQARHRGGGEGAACLRINLAISVGAKRARSGEGGQGTMVLDAYRRQCRLAGNPTSGKIWEPCRKDGGKRAQTTPKSGDLDFRVQISVKASIPSWRSRLSGPVGSHRLSPALSA